MTHVRTAHATQSRRARRRGEDWIMCNRCGMRHVVPRHQAGPQSYPPAMPLVRFLNVTASMVLLWMLVIAWALSEFGDALKGVLHVQ